MTKVIIEAKLSYEETTNKIAGIALVPRVSRNGFLYTEGEMKKGHGVTGPLDYRHNHDETIGTVKFTFDEEFQQLNYTAEITDQEFLKEHREAIKNNEMFASIEAVALGEKRMCNIGSDCFDVPYGLTFVGMALTENPGVPETSVKLVESCPCNPNRNLYKAESKGDSMAKTSKSTTKKEQDGMSAEMCAPGYVYVPDALNGAGACVEIQGEEAKKIREQNAKITKEAITDANADGAGVDQDKPADQPCGEGMKRVDGECVPIDNSKEEQTGDDEDEDEDEDKERTETKKETRAPKVTGTPQYASASKLESLTKEIAEVKKNAAKEIKEFTDNFYTTPTINAQTLETQGFANNGLKESFSSIYTKLKAHDIAKFQLDLGSNAWLREAYETQEKRNKRLTEALNFNTQDQSNKLAFRNTFLIPPNGNYTASVRNLVMYTEIPQGADEVKASLITPPTVDNITEGVANDATNYSINTVTINTDVVRGNVEKIKASDLEDTPQEILGALTEVSRITALNEEARLVFDKAAGAVTTPGAWLNATTGTTITDDNVAAVEKFSPKALDAALKYYQRQGYATHPGAIKCALEPQALQELRQDSTIQRYLQDGNPIVTESGAFMRYQGIDLIPMQRINRNDGSTTDTYRNVCFVPEYSFILASHRDLEVSIQKRPSESAYDWAWTQRKNATVYDPKSIVRLSSEQVA